MAPKPPHLRLFWAFDIPEAQKRSVEKAVQGLRLQIPEARWTARESWHVTVKFLGSVEEIRLDEVLNTGKKAAAASQPFETHLTTLGAFPTPRRARVIWIGLAAEPPAATLAHQMERTFAEQGFRKESRAFQPHLTLARLRTPGPIAEPLEAAAPFDFDTSPFQVKEVVLYRSHLHPRGASYEAIQTFPLKKPAPNS
jgi:RNA 2',3'-cyclic 3'-phosphodiesterase